MDVVRTKQVTIDGLSFKGVEARYVKVLEPMAFSAKVDEGDDGRRQATTCRVINLEDGKEYRLICPTLLVSAWTDEGEGIVGKCYEILCPLDKKPGKDYREVSVYEIEEPKGGKTTSA